MKEEHKKGDAEPGPQGGEVANEFGDYREIQRARPSRKSERSHLIKI